MKSSCSYSLLTTHYPLLTAYYFLLTSTTHYLLLTTYYLLGSTSDMNSSCSSSPASCYSPPPYQAPLLTTSVYYLQRRAESCSSIPITLLLAYCLILGRVAADNSLLHCSCRLHLSTPLHRQAGHAHRAVAHLKPTRSPLLPPPLPYLLRAAWHRRRVRSPHPCSFARARRPRRPRRGRRGTYYIHCLLLTTHYSLLATYY